MRETAVQSTHIALYASQQWLLIKNCHSTNTDVHLIYSRLKTNRGITISPKPAVNAKDSHPVIQPPGRPYRNFMRLVNRKPQFNLALDWNRRSNGQFAN